MVVADAVGGVIDGVSDGDVAGVVLGAVAGDVGAALTVVIFAAVEDFVQHEMSFGAGGQRPNVLVEFYLNVTYSGIGCVVRSLLSSQMVSGSVLMSGTFGKRLPL